MLLPYEIEVISEMQKASPVDGWERLTLEQITTCLAWSRLTGTPLQRVCEVMEIAQRDMIVSNR